MNSVSPCIIYLTKLFILTIIIILLTPGVRQYVYTAQLLWFGQDQVGTLPNAQQSHCFCCIYECLGPHPVPFFDFSSQKTKQKHNKRPNTRETVWTVKSFQIISNIYMEGNSQLCQLCLERQMPGDRLALMPCCGAQNNLRNHESCLLRWFSQSPRSPDCLYCLARLQPYNDQPNSDQPGVPFKFFDHPTAPSLDTGSRNDQSESMGNNVWEDEFDSDLESDVDLLPNDPVHAIRHGVSPFTSPHPPPPPGWSSFMSRMGKQRGTHTTGIAG